MAYYNPSPYGGYANGAGNGYPMTYPQTYNPPQQNSNGLIWVQGEAAAKAWFVAAGSSVALFDSEAPIFYIKATDASGMPMPFRKFQYSEVVHDSTPSQVALNSEEYNELKKRCDALEAMLINATGAGRAMSKREDLNA